MKQPLRIALCFLLVACNSDEGTHDNSQDEPAVAKGEAAQVENQLGPVKATVTVTPKEPVIGDMMALTLVVEAKDGVQVEMPVFQEAFTRFSIEGYANDREVIEGGERHRQSYRIQASSSGRLRIPPLRVVFVDKRADAETGGEEQELLTDEISLRVTPVLAGELAIDAELLPVRRPLEEHLGPGLWQRYWWTLALIVPLAALGVGLLFVRRRRKEIQISPYERASVALAELEAQGLPEGEELDSWYVRLSGIVRRYLEDRFALRAPELTTEEFLRVAQRSVLLSTEHKSLLTGFLADCDKVKFAGYEPGAEESRGALEAARRFLLETRAQENQENPSGESASASQKVDAGGNIDDTKGADSSVATDAGEKTDTSKKEVA